jgi:hypothetical protein
MPRTQSHPALTSDHDPTPPPKLFSWLRDYLLSNYHAGTPADNVGFTADRLYSQLLAISPTTPTATNPRLEIQGHLPHPSESIVDTREHLVEVSVAIAPHSPHLSHFYAEVNLASVYLQGSLIELFSVRSWRVMYAPFPLVITGCSKICRYRCKLNATASASLATERPMFRMYQS